MVDYGQEYIQHEEDRDPLIEHFQNVDINAFNSIGQ